MFLGVVRLFTHVNRIASSKLTNFGRVIIPRKNKKKRKRYSGGKKNANKSKQRHIKSHSAFKAPR